MRVVLVAGVLNPAWMPPWTAMLPPLLWMSQAPLPANSIVQAAANIIADVKEADGLLILPEHNAIKLTRWLTH